MAKPIISNPWTTLPARITRGYGVASGKASDSPYPQGTIALQLPYFHDLGLDLSPYYSGTLNLSIAPHSLQFQNPEWTFANVAWFPGCQETFSFSRCRLVIKESMTEALIYYPHPETKPAHIQDPAIVEVLAPYLQGLDAQTLVSLQVNSQAVKVCHSKS